MNLSPERRRTYIAVLTFVFSVVLLGVVVGVNGNWNFLQTLFWIVLVLSGILLFVWRTTSFLSALTPEFGKDTAIYSERCNVRIGFMYYSFLTTRVSVFDNLLVIRGPTEIQFLPRDIWSLKLVRVFLKAGVQIQHTRSDIMRPVILESWNSELLLESIEDGLHLQDMPQFGKEVVLEGLSEQERTERKKYSWLQ